jgi:endoglycosylceramidase
MRFFLILLLLTPLLCSNFTINLTTKNFIDPYGRSATFHGLNVVYKILPLVPQIDYYDPVTSLCPYDFELIQQWGFNNIRLLISWQGTEIEPGVYNYTYMEAVRSVVRLAAQYNISVLLDMHQDILSYKFCGDGFPMWALNITNFPAPMNIEISHDSSDYRFTTALNLICKITWQTSGDKLQTISKMSLMSWVTS